MDSTARPTHTRNYRPILWLLPMSLCFVVLAVLLALSQLNRIRQVLDYPGARQLSSHTIFRPPRVLARQDSSYISDDDFPEVVNWYSNGFNLGPEKMANSSCSHLWKSETWLLIQERVSVTVCETSSGRMIFAQRSVGLTVP
jgi:hypothetical protein